MVDTQDDMRADNAEDRPAGPRASPLRQQLPNIAAVSGFACMITALAVVQQQGDASTPSAAVQELYATLAAGNLDQLLSDETLGFRQKAEGEVRALGTAEYERVLGIYEKRKPLGEQEYARQLGRWEAVRKSAQEAGAAAFAALSSDEKCKVWVGKPREEWLFEQVADVLPDELRDRLTTSAVLTDQATYEARERQLGLAALTEAERTIATRADSDPSLAEDPYVRPILEKRLQAGRAALDEAVRAYRDAAARVPQPPADEEQRGRQADKERELGLGALGQVDRAFLDSFARIPDGADPAARYDQLGEGLLSEQERTAIGRAPRSDFEAGRAAFVAREGRRLYAEFLRTTFGTCSPEVRSVDLSSWVTGGVFRAWHAKVVVGWRSPQDVAHLAYDGGTHTHRLNDAVPAALLRAAYADQRITWRRAIDEGLLRPDVVFTPGLCEQYLGTAFRLFFSAGQWRILRPDQPAPPPPSLPSWLVRSSGDRPRAGPVGEPAYPAGLPKEVATCC